MTAKMLKRTLVILLITSICTQYCLACYRTINTGDCLGDCMQAFPNPEISCDPSFAAWLSGTVDFYTTNGSPSQQGWSSTKTAVRTCTCAYEYYTGEQTQTAICGGFGMITSVAEDGIPTATCVF
jgi:hypothetical protein